MKILNESNTISHILDHFQERAASSIRDTSEIHALYELRVIGNRFDGSEIMTTYFNAVAPLSTAFKEELHTEICERGGLQEMTSKDLMRVISSFV